MYNEVIKFIENAHEEQHRRGGEAYSSHPLEVSKNLKTTEEKILALLHDVVEETEETLSSVESFLLTIYAQAFVRKIISALHAITRQEGEEYEHYIHRCGQNELARAVKIEDIKHNLKTCKPHKEWQYRICLLYLQNI